MLALSIFMADIFMNLLLCTVVIIAILQKFSSSGMWLL